MSDAFSVIVSSDPQYPWYDYLFPCGYEQSTEDTPPEIISNAERQISQQYDSINVLVEQYDNIKQLMNTSFYPLKGVIINGDITGWGHTWQRDKMDKLTSGLKVPFYPGFGNHDYELNVTSDNDYVACSRMVSWMEKWIKEAKDAEKVHADDVLYPFHFEQTGTFVGSLAYSFIINNVRFIQLQYYPSYTKSWEPSGLGRPCQITSSFDWFERQLQDAKYRNNMIVVLLHDYNESFKYTETKKKDGSTDPDVVRFNNLLVTYNVWAVFAGHIHNLFGYQGLIHGKVPHFRSGSASFQDYLVLEIDPAEPGFVRVTEMASALGGRYQPTGRCWSWYRGQTPKEGAIQPPDPPSSPRPKSPLAGVVSSSLSWWLYYVDSQNHIHGLNGQDQTATDTDLTKAAKTLALPVSNSPLACFDAWDKPNVYYIGVDHDIRSYWYDTTSKEWKEASLTGGPAHIGFARGPERRPGDAPSALDGSGLTCFGPPEWAHLFYVDSQSHIQCVRWENTNWSHIDVTRDAGAFQALAQGGSGLTCFGAGSTAYVFYIGTNGHVYLLSNETRWSHVDLTDKAGALHLDLPQRTSGLTCFGPRGEAHVFYAGMDNCIHVLRQNPTKPADQWEHKNLTNEAGASGKSLPIPGGGLTCLGGRSAAQVFYVGNSLRTNISPPTFGTDKHVHLLGYDWQANNWYYKNLIWEKTVSGQFAKAPNVGAENTLVSFYRNRPRVWYIGDAPYVQVQELWWRHYDAAPPEWHYGPLTGTTPGKHVA